MMLPIITEQGKNILQIDNQFDEPEYAMINGQEVEVYCFTLYNERNDKPRANYMVCRNGVVLCIDKWFNKKHTRWLLEDGIAVMRDVDPFSPYSEFDLPNLW